MLTIANIIGGCMNDRKNTLSVDNLSVSYLGNEALNNVTFNVNAGKLIGIIGPNGAGKSTLIKSILGLIKPLSGEIYFNNNSISSIRKQISYVKQRLDYDLSFPIQVKDLVMFGIYPALGVFRYPNRDHRNMVLETLRLVEMEAYYKKQIGELSGGQLQRVLISRVLLQDAELIFLDEPLVGIDLDSEQKILKILKRMRDQGKTIVMVHHDLEKVVDYFDEIIILNKIVVAYGNVNKVFTKKNIADAYKGAFFDFL